LIHRHPEFWPRPDAFDPENFTPAAIEARPKLAYLPFGGGARTCIGNHLAMLELQRCIAMFVQRFDVSVPDGYEPEVQPFITLTPPNGIPLRLRERAR
jgi:cytochrome P450